MPIKKDNKKKKKIKKPRNASSLVKTTKPKPVYIFTERVPNKKCCTDVYKSGQAYTIPFGFMDRLGTTRIETPLSKTSTTFGSPVPPTITTPKEYLTIETQTEHNASALGKPSKASKKKQLIIEEDEPISVGMPEEPQPLVSEKRKYDTSKADENKMRLLSQLYNLLVVNYSPTDAVNISESYKTQSNKRIKDRINNEKQLVKKI